MNHTDIRNKLYVANWKMNMSPEQACAFYMDNVQELAALRKHADIVLCPSFVSLGMLASKHTQSTPVLWGAQNCSEHESGAYTGEVDAQSLQQVGCTYCIVGHSERRHLYGETNEVIAQKVDRLLAHNITPIICIGETAQEREQGITRDVLKAQLKPFLKLCTTSTKAAVVIAYEPVWAIGTGVTPTERELLELSVFISKHLQQDFKCQRTFVLYGGSVSPKNAAMLKKINFDGFLVGGASCDFESFKEIVISKRART